MLLLLLQGLVLSLLSNRHSPVLASVSSAVPQLNGNDGFGRRRRRMPDKALPEILSVMRKLIGGGGDGTWQDQQPPPTRNEEGEEGGRAGIVPPPPPPHRHGSDAMGQLDSLSPRQAQREPPPRGPPQDTETWGTGEYRQQEQQHVIPPPPPVTEAQKRKQHRHTQQEGQPRPPPTMAGHYNTGGDWQQPDDYWFPQQQQQFAQDAWGVTDPYQQHVQPPYSLEQDLEESMERQSDLLLQNQNLTAYIGQLEQHEELQSRQLDVLTERIMEVEARSAAERNQIVEYQRNCTELTRQVAVLEDKVEEWRVRCSEYADQREQDAADIKTLQKDLKRARLEAEDWASVVERHRLAEDDAEADPYKGRHGHRKKKKKSGFFAWLFGWGNDDDGTGRSDELDEVYEQARTTLLTALQRERSNVEELETAMSSLQHNNTAISEQVKSRDLIIDELNDRIAVFEEDKVVLKAALKQLQKEMNEEAPKTQKVVNDLEAAREEIDRLQEEIEALIETHQDEIAALREAIAAKEEAITATESNMTVIGTYVDRLEGRLADFALARRDIESREQKCKEVESSAEEAKAERDRYKARVRDLESEHEEIKTLLEEMAKERTELQSKNDRLTKDCASLGEKERQLQEALSSLSSLRRDYHALDQANADLQAQLVQFKGQTSDTIASTAKLKEELEVSQSAIEDLRRRVSEGIAERQELLEKIKQAEAVSSGLKEEFLIAEESKRVKLAETLQEKDKLVKRLQEVETAKNDLQQQLATVVEESQRRLLEMQQQKVCFMRSHRLTYPKVAAFDINLFIVLVYSYCDTTHAATSRSRLLQQTEVHCAAGFRR